MSTDLTIVMYHYVRDLRRTRYPAIKALLTTEFEEQARYLLTHYTLVRMEDVIAVVRGTGAPLPANAALLTFDDGYADCFTTVFPILDRLGVQGSFFPVAQAAAEGVVLDVNKIQFVLAAGPQPAVLVTELFAILDALRGAYQVPVEDDYRRSVDLTDRFDTPDVVLFKRLLQRDLPADVRRIALDRLFRHHVTADEATFAAELYMSPDQIRCLIRHGMYVGSHAHSHPWLDTLTQQEQMLEIERSLEFLASVGAPIQDWVMCYPYGAVNKDLLTVVRDRGCALGLTTRVGTVTSFDTPLLLPRLDTNDFPKSA